MVGKFAAAFEMTLAVGVVGVVLVVLLGVVVVKQEVE